MVMLPPFWLTVYTCPNVTFVKPILNLMHLHHTGNNQGGYWSLRHVPKLAQNPCFVLFFKSRYYAYFGSYFVVYIRWVFLRFIYPQLSGLQSYHGWGEVVNLLNDCPVPLIQRCNVNSPNVKAQQILMHNVMFMYLTDPVGIKFI